MSPRDSTASCEPCEGSSHAGPSFSNEPEETASVASDTQSSKSSQKFRAFKSETVMHALSKIAALKERHDRDRAASKTLRKAPSARENVTTAECTSCFNDLPVSVLIKLPCSHNYCKTCLATLITTALGSESTFPPKCCLSEIPPATIVKSLDKKQQELYKAKAAEFSISADRRCYCPNTACLKWIPPAKLYRSRTSAHKCPHCQTKVCVTCRGLAHARNVDCPQDPDLEATISVAESEGWRRCYSCRTMVEVGPFSLVPFYISPNAAKRSLGCRHITCRCGAQFCYVCGAQWRTCECTEIDEANRQAVLRRQRIERDEVDQAEADEVARAIAIVEGLVRREEEARQQRQAEEEQERQREEVELARLEELRLQEEAARERERQEAEQQLRDVLRLSIQEDLDSLASTLQDLLSAQLHALNERQGTEEQKLMENLNDATETVERNTETLSAKMETNVQRRMAQLKTHQEEELSQMDQRHEEQEDDVFLQIQNHLKGKPNREAREKRLLDNLRREQETERADLAKRHEEQAQNMEGVAKMEEEGLKRSGDIRKRKVKSQHESELAALLQQVVCDRKWFKVVCQRREEMVAENRRVMLGEFEIGADLVGLTEETATGIKPLPAFFETRFEEAGPTLGNQRYRDSIQQTPVELAATSPRPPSPLRPVTYMADSDLSYRTAATHISSDDGLMSNLWEGDDNGGPTTRLTTSSFPPHQHTPDANQMPRIATPSRPRRPRTPSTQRRPLPNMRTMPSGPPPPIPTTMPHIHNTFPANIEGYNRPLQEQSRDNCAPPIAMRNPARPSAPPTPPASPHVSSIPPTPIRHMTLFPQITLPPSQTSDLETYIPADDPQPNSPTRLSSITISDDLILVEPPEPSSTVPPPSTTSSTPQRRQSSIEPVKEKEKPAKKKHYRGKGAAFANMMDGDDYIARLEAKIAANEAEEREKERIRLEGGSVGSGGGKGREGGSVKSSKRGWFSRK